MSIEAYARKNVREGTIWIPFSKSLYFDSQQVDDRIIIYGLYSNSGLNYNKYLYELEAVDLINLLNDYNAKLAELSNQELIVMNDIISKRYLAQIDKLIHDEKMVTKQQEIDSDNAMWDAKIAALDADRAALITESAKVDAEIARTQAKITILTAQIAEETVNQQEVNIQIAEKELASAKVDIQQLDAQNELLRIQVQIIEKASEIVEIDVRISRIKIEEAEIRRSMARIDLLDSELIIEQAKTQTALAEEPVARARVDIARAKVQSIIARLSMENSRLSEAVARYNLEVAKYNAAVADIAYQGTLLAQEGTLFNTKNGVINLRHLVKDTALDNEVARNKLGIDNRVALANLEKTFADNTSTLQVKIDDATVDAMDGKITDETNKVNAAIAVKNALLGANIVTKLTHTIGKQAPAEE